VGRGRSRLVSLGFTKNWRTWRISFDWLLNPLFPRDEIRRRDGERRGGSCAPTLTTGIPPDTLEKRRPSSDSRVVVPSNSIILLLRDLEEVELTREVEKTKRDHSGFPRLDCSFPDLSLILMIEVLPEKCGRTSCQSARGGEATNLEAKSIAPSLTINSHFSKSTLD
jgi:hypothetical protein